MISFVSFHNSNGNLYLSVSAPSPKDSTEREISQKDFQEDVVTTTGFSVNSTTLGTSDLCSVCSDEALQVENKVK